MWVKFNSQNTSFTRLLLGDLGEAGGELTLRVVYLGWTYQKLWGSTRRRLRVCRTVTGTSSECRSWGKHVPSDRLSFSRAALSDVAPNSPFQRWQGPREKGNFPTPTKLAGDEKRDQTLDHVHNHQSSLLLQAGTSLWHTSDRLAKKIYIMNVSSDMN